MGKAKLAIPIFGKMATRSFHTAQFRETLEQHGFEPLYFIGPHYFRNVDLDRYRYFELETVQYEAMFERHALLRALALLRRFVVRTDTTDLRFRESIEARLFDFGPVAKTWIYAACMDLLRRIPGLGHLAAWSENALFPTHVHDGALKNQAVDCVLTPGAGNYGFWNEGFFAREAKGLGLPVFAAITNYDNIVNMGFRGFMPDGLAVWSQQMANEAMRLQRIPASRIEITGPVQYDRYFVPLPISREEFLRSKGLDPARKTILFAGGVNITRYFEFYRLLTGVMQSGSNLLHNVVVRPYPHVKLLASPGWQVLEGLFARTEGVYLSNPLNTSSDNLASDELQRDLGLSERVDELYCLLQYSDVMINYFSTISLEAAICDLPVIHIGYDVYTFGHRYNTSAAFQQRQTHNRRDLRLAAARIAKDEADLVKFIDLYLEDRTLDREARYEYALSECGYLDGLSSKRLALMLQNRICSLNHGQ